MYNIPMGIVHCEECAVSEMITIEISETTARVIHDIAARTGRDPKVVLGELVNRSVMDLPVESLSDEQVIALADLMMSDDDQAELSNLLADQREGNLDDVKQARLNELMQIYRHGLVRKSEAIRVAIQRGLRPSLADG
jgi:hypothetical protein